MSHHREALFVRPDRVGPLLWRAFPPQQGRTSRKNTGSG